MVGEITACVPHSLALFRQTHVQVRYGEINGDWRLIVLGDTVGEATDLSFCLCVWA